MKHYLDLIPISAKIRRRQNRMSVLCIVLAVFLVTTIFGMADMFIRSQLIQARIDYGDFHIGIRDLTAEEAELISSRPELTAARYGVLNYRGDEGYTLSGKTAILMGCDEPWITEMNPSYFETGNFPQKKGEVLITDNARETLDLALGDPITVDTPDGRSLTFTVSGFMGDAAKNSSEDSYGIVLRMDDFFSVYPAQDPNTLTDFGAQLYIRFSDTFHIRNSIAALKEQYALSDSQVTGNTKLLGLLGQSNNSFMLYTYFSAIVLALLVLIASVFMITGSLSSSIARRTEFFGLIRCIGATPRQVARLVRKEALRWCRIAIPAGTGLGVAIIWILCAVLRLLSPEYFEAIPVFAISLPSILAGIVTGLLTVLLAARSPARRASKVSPLIAASGGADNRTPVHRAADTKFLKVDIALGLHHAWSSRKNLLLIAGSFGLSIILFLSFSVAVDMLRHSLTPLRPWTADLSVISPDYSCSVDSTYLETLQENPAVSSAYGRMFAYELPATANGKELKADLISYEEHQFNWSEDYLLEGSAKTVQNEPDTGLIVYEPENSIKVGDTVLLSIGEKAKEIRIAGMLSTSPFMNEEGISTIICSEDTFRQLTGETDYTIIDIQLSPDATDADVNEIHRLTGDTYTFADERIGNASARGTYYCFWLFVYGFLVLIALITIFNVVNTISMSTAARTREYGVFRAIGLSFRQLARMVSAEAAAYAVSGSILGTALGLVFHRLLFSSMISHNWGDAWSVPWRELGIILLLLAFSVILAVRSPLKRLCRMSVVDNISTQ